MLRFQQPETMQLWKYFPLEIQQHVVSTFINDALLSTDNCNDRWGTNWEALRRLLQTGYAFGQEVYLPALSIARIGLEAQIKEHQDAMEAIGIFT